MPAPAPASAPVAALCVYNTQGRPHGRTHNDGVTNEHNGVQLRIRADGEDAGYAKALALAAALDAIYRAAVVVNATNYLLHAVHRAGSILPLGPEEGDVRNYLWTINALLKFQEV